MLADLRLEELPDDVLKMLKRAIGQELMNRNRCRVLDELHAVYLQNTSQVEKSVSEQSWTIPASFPFYVARADYRKRSIYLPRLLAQDWSSVFPESETVVRRFYVYIHYDPRTQPIELDAMTLLLKGQPFYVGKGTGRRAWDLKRNQGHGKRLMELRRYGYKEDTIVQILVDNLTEQEALILEAKLIYFFGSVYGGYPRGCLLNLAEHTRPKFLQKMEDFRKRKTGRTPRRKRASMTKES